MATFDVVFEGGGAKGIAFVGALEELGKQGHKIRRYIGTSAGAITAALCAAGYTTEEMMTAILETRDGKPRFSTFMDIPTPADFSAAVRRNSLTMEALKEIQLPLVSPAIDTRLDDFLVDKLVENRTYSRAFSFVECGGFFAGRTFLEWTREKLKLKGIDENDTFKTFNQKTGSDLSVVASDTTAVELLVLNHRTAPDVPVANAVRMSMSIPFVWQEVIWQSSWGSYMGRSKAGNTIVDGGVLSNFPIRLIATRDDATEAIMGDTDPAAALNLGLLIDEALPVPGAPNVEATPLPVTHLRPVQRVSRLIDTMMRASDTDMIRRFERDICHLPAKGYGTLEFGLTGDRLALFLNGARSAMRQHLGGRMDLARAVTP